MNVQQRIAILTQLGTTLKKGQEELEQTKRQAKAHNQWFTIAAQDLVLQNIVEYFLKESVLQDFAANYPEIEQGASQSVGIIMAGNIPLVGFHDFLCVFLSGHHAKIKLSEKDKFLLPHLVDLMSSIEPAVSSYVSFVDRLEDFDAVIATGSNNTSRYFEAYFGKYPNIIRKNRHSIAVLSGEETKEELHLLGEDIFTFFGLGCRSVAHLYVPEGYDFNPLLEQLHEYKELILHNKYKNNFDYNYSLLILNKLDHYNNGCVLLTPERGFQDRISCLSYSYYIDQSALTKELQQDVQQLQCVVSQSPLKGVEHTPIGTAQQPSIESFADGMDTMAFLQNLHHYSV